MSSKPATTAEERERALAKLHAATTAFTDARRARFQCQLDRDEAILAAHAAGVGLLDLAHASHLTRPRVSQLVREVRRAAAR